MGYTRAMIFFFYGPNSYASRRQVDSMIEAYVKKTGSDLGLEKIEGSETDPKAMAGSLQASPFLASSRLVIVSRLSQNKTAVEGAIKLLGNVPETTVAVFYETDIDQRTSWFKKLSEKADKTVKFEPLTPPQLSAWIQKEVKRQGGSIERTAVAKLIELVGDDQWRLEQEINKLVNYEPAVSLEAVNELVIGAPQDDIFDLVQAMTGGRTARAIEVYRGLREARSSEVYILSMIIWQLRNLLLAKSAGRISPPELAKQAGMSPYVAQKSLAAASQFQLEDLRQAFMAAVETDYRIKTGDGQPDQLLESLIYHVAKVAG